MFAARGYRASTAQAATGFWIVLESLLILVGLVMAVQAYRPLLLLHPGVVLPDARRRHVVVRNELVRHRAKGCP